MGPRHIPDGSDFSSADFASMKDFGFSGSAQGYDTHPVAPPFAGSAPTHGPNTTKETTPAYAHGGMHMHPHGHQVHHTEHRAHDGAVIHHHAHGGHTVHHADGRVTHHHHDGRPVEHHAHGGMAHPHQMHDSSEVAHHARGGHHRHPKEGSAAEESGESPSFEAHEDEGAGMAMGGRHVRMPRGMMPKATHFRPLGEESALNRAPRNPTHSTTPHNAMPGGEMGYGVQPSAEPDMAPPEEGITQMRRGGSHRAKRHKG